MDRRAEQISSSVRRIIKYAHVNEEGRAWAQLQVENFPRSVQEGMLALIEKLGERIASADLATLQRSREKGLPGDPGPWLVDSFV